jgi:enoyl-CoA hydratase/carnithine racemase
MGGAVVNYEHIMCDLDGSLMVVTLNRPEKLNAYTGQMGAEITDAFQRADADDNVRAIIVTGSGRAFCAGADVSGGAASFDTSGQHGAVSLPLRSLAAAALSRRSSTAENPRSRRSTDRRSASGSR